MNVPKIIHQIWLGPRPRPQFWMDTWQIDYIQKYPEWQYRLWTEKEVENLTLYNQDVYQKLEKLDPKYDKFAGMADVLRYEILYQIGGLFIDADSIWMNERDLDEVLDKCQKRMEKKALRRDVDVTQCLFCAWEPEKNHVANGVMGANPGNPVLRRLIEEILPRRCRRFTLTKPFKSVGPFLLDIVRKDMVVLPAFFFYPVYWHHNQKKKVWLDPDEKEMIRKDCYMYQFGYSTNRLTAAVARHMKMKNDEELRKDFESFDDEVGEKINMNAKKNDGKNEKKTVKKEKKPQKKGKKKRVFRKYPHKQRSSRTNYFYAKKR